MLFLRLVSYKVHHEIQSQGPGGLEHVPNGLHIWKQAGLVLKKTPLHFGQIPDMQLDHIIKDAQMVMANVSRLNHHSIQMMSLWDWGCSPIQRPLDCTLGYLGSWLQPPAFLETKEKASANCVPLVLALTDSTHSIQLKISSHMMSELGRNCILSMASSQFLIYIFCLSPLFFRREAYCLLAMAQSPQNLHFSPQHEVGGL